MTISQRGIRFCRGIRFRGIDSDSAEESDSAAEESDSDADSAEESDSDSAAEESDSEEKRRRYTQSHTSSLISISSPPHLPLGEGMAEEV